MDGNKKICYNKCWSFFTECNTPSFCNSNLILFDPMSCHFVNQIGEQRESNNIRTAKYNCEKGRKNITNSGCRRTENLGGFIASHHMALPTQHNNTYSISRMVKTKYTNYLESHSFRTNGMSGMTLWHLSLVLLFEPSRKLRITNGKFLDVYQFSNFHKRVIIIYPSFFNEIYNAECKTPV